MEVIKFLKTKERAYLKTKIFSQNPGIYAFFFIGDIFPVFSENVQNHQIIYIGKTESSQESRNAKTHFSSGKTGSSTVRKSIGAILSATENLKSIPRNANDYSKGRFSHFKFDDHGEAIITDWMVNNLSIAFFDFQGSKEDLDQLESEIINLVVPILNIDYKNQKNPYAKKIKSLRKMCAQSAQDSPSKMDKDKETGKIVSNDFDAENGVKTNFITVDNITEKDFIVCQV